MNVIRRPLPIFRENRRVYWLLNFLYYGLVVIGMVFVAFNPAVQEALLEGVGQAFMEGPLEAVGSAYGEGEVLSAMVLTFAVNLFIGSFLYITLPSLFIPFSGVLLGLVRAVLWGLLLSPTSPELGAAMIPHSLTLLLEGQAYILAMFAAYVHGKATLFPSSLGLDGPLRGYLAGLKRTAWIYIWVAGMLAVAAIYEALEVIYLVPLFV